MNLAMANGFSGVGFTEMNEQEMMWIDGGDFGDFLSGVKSVCKSLVATSVGTCAAAVAAAAIVGYDNEEEINSTCDACISAGAAVGMAIGAALPF